MAKIAPNDGAGGKGHRPRANVDKEKLRKNFDKVDFDTHRKPDDKLPFKVNYK